MGRPLVYVEDMSHYRRGRANPKHDDYRSRDTSYRAGRAVAMDRKQQSLCTCAAQMLPHDWMPRVCPVMGEED